MLRLHRTAGLFLALCSAFPLLGAARAQIFISASGNDSNACSRTAPCRTLQRGVNATSPGRELTILTSGEYGRATITKGMTVLAEGVSANIRSFASNLAAIDIDASGQKVALKGLFLTGGNRGGVGIQVRAAASVHIEDCTVERFVFGGIRLISTGSEVFVSNTVSRNNASDGLRAPFTGASDRLTVDNSRFENNAGNGLVAFDGVTTITRSIFSGNGDGSANTGNGVWLGTGGGVMNVSESTASENRNNGFYVQGGRMNLDDVVARTSSAQTGLYIDDGADAFVTDSSFFGLGLDVYNEGTLFTYGNNSSDDLSNSGTMITREKF
jgi:hypothetical protein